MRRLLKEAPELMKGAAFGACVVLFAVLYIVVSRLYL